MGDARANLIDGLAEHVGVAPLTPTEIESVLALAAVAAHGTGDRTTAPLASFLAGLAAAKADDRAGSLDEVRRRAAELAPPAEPSSGSLRRGIRSHHRPGRRRYGMRRQESGRRGVWRYRGRS